MVESGSSPPRTVCDLLDQQTRIRPDSIAVRTPVRSWTYADLDDVTTRLGQRLWRSGTGPGTLVGLLAPLGPAALMGLVATLRCGAACLPLDPDDPPSRLKGIARDVGCDLIIAAQPIDWCPDALLIDLPSLCQDDLSATILKGPTSLDLAYVITTSGSTGRPKPVAVPHDALLNLIVASIDDFDLAERDAVLWSSRPTVDVTMQDCLMALCSGATVVVPDADDFLPRGILTAARTLGATVVDIPAAVVGAHGQSLLPRLARAGVRLVITGGSRLDGTGLAGAVDSIDPMVVVNAYGPTETAVTATLYRCPVTPPRWPPIGRPIRGVQAYVLDEGLTRVAVGSEGQLYIAGQGLSWGYLGQPGRTASVFLPDPFDDVPGRRMYATGDRVRLRADGDLEFLDRMDNQVKVSGFRIEIGEVEHHLHECPGVHEAAVLVREDVPGGRALIAFLVGDQTTESKVRERLNDLLPRYMIPKFYVWMDKMPLNRQGKLDRRALAEVPIRATVLPGGGPGSDRRRVMVGEARPEMSDNEDCEFCVLINHEEQYSIWPADREVPAGWHTVGENGHKADCLAYIDYVWTDIRPLSLREQMAADQSEAAT